MQHPQERQVIDVGRGLFVVRYSAAQDLDAPPVVHLSSDTQRGNALRFIMPPDARGAELSGPGASAVMLSEGPGHLVLSVRSRRPTGSIACKITVETLNGGPEQIETTRLGPRRADGFRADGFAILGHVAGRGDVRVRADEWLAGPKMPARIEGLQFDWPGKPDGIDLSYSVVTARPQPSQRPMSGLGAFAGSRGKATPIVGLELTLSGHAASRARLAADMLFLGAPVLHVSGRHISGAGPTGREPLVGLKLGLEIANDRPIPAARHAAAPVVPARTLREVRIFRAETPDLPMVG